MASLDKYKLSSVTWDSDKEPGKFVNFMMLMSAMVRAISHGSAIEDFLDKKLGRKKHIAVSTPSFLTEDPEFRRPAEIDDDEGYDTDSVQNQPSLGGSPLQRRIDASRASGATSSRSTLQEAGSSYWELGDEVLALDATLYNVLKMSVKGGKSILLDCVQWPSYIQAMCILYKHSDISKNDRITRAFNTMDKLTYNGDVQVWQADAMSSVRELFESGASIMHYALSRILASFNGKLKTIQYKIAEDMNSREIDNMTNIFDMVQSYATDIASVGDSRHAANAVFEQDQEGYVGSIAGPGQKGCGWCKHIGHEEHECRKKQQAKADADSSYSSSNRSQAGDSEGF